MEVSTSSAEVRSASSEGAVSGADVASPPKEVVPALSVVAGFAPI